MIDELQEEAAALYALDLLEPAETAAFEVALAGSPELRARVRELRETAAALAHAAPSVEPPAALKARILASARSRRSPGAASGNVLPFSVLIPWAIAASLAVCSAWTARLYFAGRSEAALLRNQQTLADLELRSARDQLEAERIVSQRELTDSRQDLAAAARRLADLHSEIASLEQQQRASGSLADYKVANLGSTTGRAPGMLAVAVWCPSMQQGILAVSNLGSLPAGKDYQLWVIDPDYAVPISAGVFSIDPATGGARVTFTTTRPIRKIGKFAVSMEPKGGSVAPRGPIVLLSDSPTQPST